ncbi:MAG: cyclic nucleotide-binding domain-containing protein [Nitrospirae bacterium]|nr:cyclic nucleotide-binding domain-containing protein [Nitrospirota bacterium]MBI3392630.1 cyclic nucleotide-binding domain-containing protein [Nitrospirota bacterium]
MPAWELLKPFSVCRGLIEKDLRRLSEFVEERVLSDGEDLYSGHERPAGVVFVVSGKMAVSILPSGAGEEASVEVGPGETMAELSLFEAGPPAVSARSAGESRILFLPRHGFESWAARSPEGAVLFQARILADVGRRLRRLEGALRLVAGVAAESAGREETTQ